MSEVTTVSVPGPFTVASISEDLRALGVEPGMTLLVHSSLSSIGWVVGGAHAVVEALLNVLGPTGTLMVPTHSGDLSEPSHWRNPAVPPSWWTTIRAQMPAYDTHLTATRGLGVIADTVRYVPGALRSEHPSVSFCAVGPNARFLTEHHALEPGLDHGSPLGRLWDLDGAILLLGVTHSTNTSLHLAEVTSATVAPVRQGAPVLVDGVRRWVTYDTFEWDTDDFEMVGAAINAAGLERSGTIGAAQSFLMAQRPVVAFAATWFTANRTRDTNTITGTSRSESADPNSAVQTPIPADRKPPRGHDAELETLLLLLGFQRESLVRKCEGLTDEQLAWSPVHTKTSLWWLVEHLTNAEFIWMAHRFSGEQQDPLGGDAPTTGAELFERYRRRWALTDAIVRESADPTALCVNESGDPAVSLRWVLGHLLEETARHAGHGDVIRELLDGTTGR